MSIRRSLFTLGVVAAALVVSAGIASAHERRTVGDYQLVVGFAEEPAIVDEPNGLSLRVQQGEGESGTPVEGLDQTLQAEVIFGDEVMPLELRPAFGSPGEYVADLIPTAEGAYTFHIFGTIDGTAIDERFTSGPETFSEVESRAALSFPAQADATAETGEADSARMFGIAGLVVGALGLVAGVAALVMVRGARASAGSAVRASQPESASEQAS